MCRNDRELSIRAPTSLKCVVALWNADAFFLIMRRFYVSFVRSLEFGIMQKLVISFIAVVAVALAACGPRNSFRGEFRHIDEPAPVALACEKIGCDIPGAAYGFAVDSLYVAFTMHPKHRMAVCDLRTMNTLAEIVNVGRGPDEYNYISVYNHVFRDGGDLGVWIYSSEMGRAAKVNLTRSCRERRTVVDTTVIMRDHAVSAAGGIAGQVVTFDVLNDSLAIYRTVTEKQVLETGICDYRARRIFRRFDMYEQMPGDPSLAAGTFGVKHDLSRVAFVPAMLDQTDFCDIDGCNAFSVSTRRKPVTVEDVARTDPSQQRGYTMGVCFTDDRIVINRPDYRTGTTSLRIFDWDGRLLHVLQPDVVMNGISLGDDGVLYGMISDTELCRADISGYL